MPQGRGASSMGLTCPKGSEVDREQIDRILADLQYLPRDHANALADLAVAEGEVANLKGELSPAEDALELALAELMNTTKLHGSNQKARDAEFKAICANNGKIEHLKGVVLGIEAGLRTRQNEVLLLTARAKHLGYQLRATIAAANLWQALLLSEEEEGRQ